MKIEALTTPEIFLEDAFLSNASPDEEIAREIVCGLEIRNKMIWFAPNRIPVGGCIATKVDEGLENSRHLIILLSPSYVASDWCARERSFFQFAVPNQSSRKIIPVLLEDCQIPSSLRSVKRCDMRGGVHPDKIEEIANML